MIATCAFSKNLPGEWVEHGTTESSYLVAMEKEDGSGQAAVRPQGDRAHAVEATTAVSGVASRGEHTAAVRAWRRWRGRPAGGTVERKVCGR